MKVSRASDLNGQLVEWNDAMYRAHPTPYGGFAGYIERVRMRAVLDLAGIQQTDAVLEVGCEGGGLLIATPPARRVVGLDISGAALEDAMRKFEARARSAEFFQCDAQNPLPFERGEFDVIICSEVLEHAAEPARVLRNIREICTEKTRIAVSIPLERFKVRVKTFLRAIGLFHLLFPRIEEGQSEWHVQTFSRRMLEDLSKNLFVVKRGRGIWAIHFVALLQACPADSEASETSRASG